MARAANSFPVPLSPVISTELSVCETLSSTENICLISLFLPTMFSYLKYSLKCSDKFLISDMSINVSTAPIFSFLLFKSIPEFTRIGISFPLLCSIRNSFPTIALPF